METERKVDWLSVLAVVAALGASLVLWRRLPDSMPIHWNAAGQPDGYGSRLVGAFLMPVVMVGIYLMFEVLPRIDPRRRNYERFADTYRFLRTLLILFMMLVHGLTLYSVVYGGNMLSSNLMFAAVGLLFVLLGNYMPRFRPTWFVGIRTPWTLSSDRIWRKTHRLGGRLFFLVGLALIAAIWLPAQWIEFVLLGAVLVAAIVPIAYSYWLFRQGEGGEMPGQKEIP
ncbi:MAG: SdpI family protein [Anaerolineales bacterium]